MLFFEEYSIDPWGRKDPGAPRIHGLRHEVYLAMHNYVWKDHSIVMKWLKDHEGLKEEELILECLYCLLEHEIKDSYYINYPDSIGARLLDYYSLEELTEKFSRFGIVEVQSIYSFKKKRYCMELILPVNVDNLHSWNIRQKEGLPF